MQTRFVTLMIVAVLLAGCGHSSNPDGGRQRESAKTAASSGSASERVPDARKYETTPLSDADVGLYLEVMRVAADHITHATGDDRAAIDLLRQVNAGKAQPTLEQANLLSRGTQLSEFDEEIAQQRGVEPTYMAIRGVIESLVGSGACPDCSGDSDEKPNAAQQAQDAKFDGVRNANITLLAAHRAEITTLQKQVRGFMHGQ